MYSNRTVTICYYCIIIIIIVHQIHNNIYTPTNIYMYTGTVVLSSRFQSSTQAHGDLKFCEGYEQILEVPLSKVVVQYAFHY